MNFEISVGIGRCSVHKSAPDTECDKVTIVMAPLKFEDKGTTTLLAWACSMGSSCHNDCCVYAKGGTGGKMDPRNRQSAQRIRQLHHDVGAAGQEAETVIQGARNSHL